jgi:transcriptional regulator with XRE-family HTH domain
MDSIRARFKHVRRLRGLTQREVASSFNVDTGTVYRWESGTSPLTLPTLEAASALFSVNRVWLVFGEGDGPHYLPSDPPPGSMEDDEPPATDSAEGAA